MVKTVIGHQLSVIRKGRKIYVVILFNYQLLIMILFVLAPLNAKDFGIQGRVSPISEEDPIVLIQSKLKTLEEMGELEQHNRELQKKTRAAIERPKAVEGVSKATKARVFTYDPTYVVQEDIKDHQGRIIHFKGTRINPLETVNLGYDLLFFDGDDADQVAFAKEKLKEKLKEKSVKLILVKGVPLALSEELKVPVYFDQGGFLTKKLGIRHVPALVTQKGFNLRIEEIYLSQTSVEKKREGSPPLQTQGGDQ